MIWELWEYPEGQSFFPHDADVSVSGKSGFAAQSRTAGSDGLDGRDRRLRHRDAGDVRLSGLGKVPADPGDYQAAIVLRLLRTATENRHAGVSRRHARHKRGRGDLLGRFARELWRVDGDRRCQLLGRCCGDVVGQTSGGQPACIGEFVCRSGAALGRPRGSGGTGLSACDRISIAQSAGRAGAGAAWYRRFPAGTTIGTAAMRALPLGVPKLMVSTLASGKCVRRSGQRYPDVKLGRATIAGINRISPRGAGRGGPCHGRYGHSTRAPDDRRRATTAHRRHDVRRHHPLRQRARRLLEAAGYEVLVFHATGNGGQAMESLIDEA